MKKSIFFVTCMIALASLTAWTPPAEAYTDFNGGCDSCHGAFLSGTYTSNTSKDPVSWGTTAKNQIL